MTNELNDSAQYRAERAAEPSDPAQPAVVNLSQRDYDERLARRTAGHQSDEDLRVIKMYERAGYKPGGPAPDDADKAPAPEQAKSAEGETAWRGNSTGTSSGTTPKNSGASSKIGPSSAPSTPSGSKSR